MATTKFDIKTEALKPVFAYVGVTDLAVEKVRDALAAVQKDVTTRVADVRKTDPKALRTQAMTAVNARVDAIAKDAQARREAIEARVTELQSEAKAYPARVQTALDENVVTVANSTYADLVKRGESLVTRIRKQESSKAAVASAKTTVTKAKTTATQAKKAADAEVTATKKTATAQKTAVKKARSQVAEARKTAQKAPARKAATKKTSVAKSSAKATATAATTTATNAVKAVADAAEKVGD